MERKPLISLQKAQEFYGIENTTFVRPRYVPQGACEWCGNQIEEKRRKSCCSKKCSNKFNVATSSIYYRNKGSRGGYGNHILRRDNYTCQLCQTLHTKVNRNKIPLPTTDGQLEIHHKQYVSDGGTDDPRNLITLCKECHKRVHREKIDFAEGEVI